MTFLNVGPYTLHVGANTPNIVVCRQGDIQVDFVQDVSDTIYAVIDCRLIACAERKTFQPSLFLDLLQGFLNFGPPSGKLS